MPTKKMQGTGRDDENRRFKLNVSQKKKRECDFPFAKTSENKKEDKMILVFRVTDTHGAKWNRGGEQIISET
jgi:hypothetical protein